MSAFLTSPAADVQLWHRAVADRLRTGQYTHLIVEPQGDLYKVKGVYPDGSTGQVLAKYLRRFRAEDAVTLVTHLAATEAN